jgi:hypothetical protein
MDFPTGVVAGNSGKDSGRNTYLGARLPAHDWGAQMTGVVGLRSASFIAQSGPVDEDANPRITC